MIFKVKKGNRNFTPFRFWVWSRKKTYTWKVIFYRSCKYDINGVDQADINKLCGVGYFSKLRLVRKKYFNRFWFYTFEPMHWTDSARFGWRYYIDEKIELLAYCYVNRNRISKSVSICEIGIPYYITLDISNGVYTFTCKEVFEFSGDSSKTETIVSRNFKNWKYRLGIYFGGNQVAPHDMEIKLKML